jgi:hypothetical protein
MHYYTDLGSMKQCEEEVGGSYVSFALTLSMFPLQVPLSFCLPKTCDKHELFYDIVSGLNENTDKLLTTAK